MVPWRNAELSEHLLRFGSSEIDISRRREAVVLAEPGAGNRQMVTRAELVARVGQLASALTRLGVVRGDRVAGYLPNRLDVSPFLPPADLGAIWSNCPPELSSRGVVDRLAQMEPKSF